MPRSIYNDADAASDYATYSHTTALDLRQRFATIFASIVDIDRTQAPLSTKINRIDAEVAPPLDQLIHDEQQFRSSDARVVALQDEGLGTLIGIRSSVTEWRQALSDNSEAELATSEQHFLVAIHCYEAWSATFGS